MASITSTGIGSGLDVNAIITQLMALEKRPLNILQTAATDLTTQVSAVGKLQGFTSALRDAASKLTSVTLWNQTKATTGDATAVGVVTDGGAATGSFAVNVSRLATAQTVTSRAFASKTDAVGAGRLTIELGTWTGNAAPDDFTAKTGSTALSIDLTAEDSSLESIRDKINAAGAGVLATIVNDASGSRLSLRSSETGAENAFRVTATEETDDGVDSTGLSALAYSVGATGGMTRYQTAQNAQATINGIPIESASNQLTDVVDGVTMTLLKTTTSEVQVEVDNDDDAVKTAVTNFTKAFNDLAGYIRDQTKYDAQTKKGGTLQGDRTALGLQSQLRGVLNNESSASSVFTTLADVGISIKSDGTLAVDDTKLSAGLAKRSELKKLFAADGTTSAASGFMDRFKDLAAQLLDDGGSIDLRMESLEAMQARNQKQQDQMQSRLEQTEKRLRKQYETLDSNMAKMSSLSAYIAQQLGTG